MLRQPCCRSNLLVPAKATLRIVSEFDIVGWVGINKIVRLKLDMIERCVRKLPICQDGFVRGKASLVIDRRVFAERHVELAAAIESAESVVAGPV